MHEVCVRDWQMTEMKNNIVSYSDGTGKVKFAIRLAFNCILTATD